MAGSREKARQVDNKINVYSTIMVLSLDIILMVISGSLIFCNMFGGVFLAWFAFLTTSHCVVIIGVIHHSTCILNLWFLVAGLNLVVIITHWILFGIDQHRMIPWWSSFRDTTLEQALIGEWAQPVQWKYEGKNCDDGIVCDDTMRPRALIYFFIAPIYFYFPIR